MRARWFVVAVGMVIGLSGAGPRGQVPPGPRSGFPPRDATGPASEVGTSRIAGRVVAADTGRPLRRVQVRVSAQRVRGGRLASTDEEGRYEIPDLPGGSYTVTASKGGYVSLQHGQRHPLERGTPIELTDGTGRDNVHFSLSRGGVITGAVVDEFGEAVAEAFVQALSYRFIGGERRLVPTQRDQTNDIGEYRLFGLPPGDYYVSATLQTSRRFRDATTDSTGYAATYYPGTPNAGEANRVTVGVGQQVAAVSFGLMPVAVARVAGRVTNSLGEPLAGAFVGLTADGGVPVAGVRTPGGRTQADGSFAITSVPPGRYRIRVRTGRGGRGRVADRDSEFADYVVSVMGTDVDNLLLTTTPGASAFGSITVDGGLSPTFSAKSVQVDAVAAQASGGSLGGPTRARVDDDWSFEIPGLFGERLIRASGLPEGWVLHAVRLGGRDVTDDPLDFTRADPSSELEVVLTSQVSQVTGAVSDDDGVIVDYTVVVFSDDPSRWGYPSRFVAATRARDDGQFSIRGLPPDRYLAAALSFVEGGAWSDPEFLERLRLSARSFDLGAGGTVALDLELAPSGY